MKNQKMYESGGKTVEETCLDNGADTYTFLTVVNYTINGSGDSGQNVDALSDREKNVIIALVQGMPNKEIANHLCISVNTVITHRRNIAQKLQIHSPAMALPHKLTPPSTSMRPY